MLPIAMLICLIQLVSGQETRVRGQVAEMLSQRPLEGISISINGSDPEGVTDGEGRFDLTLGDPGNYILLIGSADYIPKRIPVQPEGGELELGLIFLEKDQEKEQSAQYITLSSDELSEEETGNSELLQSTRDIFLNRVAFDFGQAFFRIRGYDTARGVVLLNGIPMNKFRDGRPQWNNWGGLNDVTRNQEFDYGLQASEGSFGGLLGTTQIDMSPSSFRPGSRVSFASSNRGYASRIMATHSSGKGMNDIAYAISASRRWSRDGYISGTFYDAYSVYGGLEYTFSESHNVRVTGILAATRRGLSPAITQEVFELQGSRYNAHWGWQDGKVRNSRVRKIREPLLVIDHAYKSSMFTIRTALAYQFGNQTRSRMSYYDAPNPDPSYYRNLPSYYINSPLGANFYGAKLASAGFLANPQLDWAQLYAANHSEGPDGVASYLVSEDGNTDSELTLSSVANVHCNKGLRIDGGLLLKSLSSENFSRISDLLGAGFHNDIDPFTNTRNDLNGPVEKQKNDIISYHYLLEADRKQGFLQLHYSNAHWKAFFSGEYSAFRYQRNGRFMNERFPENSLGESESVTFSCMGIKAGFSYSLSGRHWLEVQAAHLQKPPQLQHVFVNPRENNLIIPLVDQEYLNTMDFSYHLRLPHITGRFSGYYTRFQDMTDINYFFVDAGVGSYFVQEVITGLDKLHMGLETGLEFEASATVKLSIVAAVGKQLYASNPDITINFVPDPEQQDSGQSVTGYYSLGPSGVKDYRLAEGPQRAVSCGVSYRDPKYWWTSVTANYLSNNYINVSFINRTRSFYRDPQTGTIFPEAIPERVDELLKQTPLEDIYYLNMAAGKSWLKRGIYISLFGSINNLFNGIFRTGGYEQSRNGNYGQLASDQLSGKQVFGPKYWYGAGRTYFVNLAVSF